MRSINHLIEHLKKSIETGEPFFPQEHDIEVLEEYTNISLPSAEDIQQSEQYKKGFEDAKRAILVEYARESENMRKRNAQLEVMLNIQKELSAEADWIPCSERLPLVGGEFLVTLVDNDGTWVSTAQWNMTFGGRWQDIFPNDGYRDISNVIAWKTLPIPYREDDEA